MAGETYGDSLYGGELPPWRAIVEAGVDSSAQVDGAIAGASISLSTGAVGAVASEALGPVAITEAVGDATAQSTLATSGVVLIEAASEIDGKDASDGTGVMVQEVAAAIEQGGDASMAPVAVGSSASQLSSIQGEFTGVASPISMGTSTSLVAAVETELDMSANELPSMQDPQSPELLPLYYSFEADDIETELKELFMLLFETYLRSDERHANALGMPHLGPRELIEQSLAADGLSIYRGATVAAGAGAYLLRSWRSFNPKRGKHLLETYLQLLWPNVWDANQMWQEKTGVYPEVLTETDGGNHFLTSRINVTLPSRATTGGDVNAISSGLRAALPARMVMNLAITTEEQFDAGLACACYAGLTARHYEGTFS